MILRWYQDEAVKSIFDYFSKNNGNPCVAIPTGAGKSLIIAGFCHTMLMNWPYVKILMATHTKEIIKQNADKLKQYWPASPVGLYSAGLNERNNRQPITFGGIGTLINTDLGKIDILIVDEAHMISTKESSQYQRLIATLKKDNPNLRIVGLTATPYRMGQGLITEGGILTDICYDLTSMDNFNRLIKEGYLSPIVPRRTQTYLDTSTVGKSQGDFKQNELQAVCDIDEITYKAVQETIEQGYDRKSWLVFCTGIEHAEHVNSCLQSFGISSTVVHSKMPSKDVDSRLEQFRQGEFQAICNNGILTTGFDHPEIDMIVMLRPTASVPLWLQCAGRGLRVAPGKTDCLLLDFGRNCERLGPINDPIIPKKRNPKPGEVPIKICPQCNTYHHCTTRTCDVCGYVFPKYSTLQDASSGAELLRNSEPIIEDIPVDKVFYYKHSKIDSPPSMRVDYICGVRKFSEYVCIEHQGFAQNKAWNWWRLRMANIPIPDTVEKALNYVAGMKVPSTIRVIVNRKYPVILECLWNS